LTVPETCGKIERFEGMTEPLIHVAGLRKFFGTYPVLDGVSLEVRAGEAVALLGSNGAGKTTLLRILATLSRPTKGTARIAGHDCARQPEAVRARLGFVAHGSWVYEDLSALENLHFWATLGGLRAGDEALRAALAAVELDRFSDERVRTFSAGMKRRLSLARFVVAQPSVLLLDEPFAALDQRATKWLEGHLAQFKARGGALLMTTHSFWRGFSMADRVLILAGGRIAHDGPLGGLSPDEVRRLYELHVGEPA
jgi:heme ABC exporter ATP-binding subunit CcmA